MNSVLKLARKRVVRFRFIHLLATVLIGAVVTVALTYQGYVGALADNFKGRLIYPELPGDVALQAPGLCEQPNTARHNPTLHLTMWNVTTRHGNVRMAGVIGTRQDNWPHPKEHEVWLPASLRGQVYNEVAGDSLLLTYLGHGEWRQAELTVAGYYEDGRYLSPILVNQAWGREWLGPSAVDETIIVYPQEAYSLLRRNVTSIRGASLVPLDHSLHGANYLVSNMYAGGNGAILLGIAFLAIGIGTFGLLVFLDSRSEIAVLKALGLKPKEASRLLWIEFSLSALFGLLLGWGTLNLLQERINFPLKLDLALLRLGFILVSAAFTVALYAPARLANVATVSELLLKRPILLWTQKITPVEGSRPALHDLISQGWTCLQLERDDNGFLGSVIPVVGTYVRQGELLAWQPIWFGMGEKRYVAPHDGVLQVIDPQRGVLAISDLQAAATCQIAQNGGTDNE